MTVIHHSIGSLAKVITQNHTQSSLSSRPQPSLQRIASQTLFTTRRPQLRFVPRAVDPASSLAATQAVYELAVDPSTAGILAAVLRPALSIASLAMIVRIVLTWYPEIDATQMPWTIVFTPTEPLLSATRKVVKPFNGLDISPIVWVALLSFVSEILTGPQGILSLIERKML